LFDEEFVRRCRNEYQRWQEDIFFIHRDASFAINDLLERAPALILPAIANPHLLDFAEHIIGPFVQLDSVVIVGSPSSKENQRGGVVCWHRDRFATFPVDGVYTMPNTLIVLCYLQEMNYDIGPLRVIPRSHRSAIALREKEAYLPHSNEHFLFLNAGDAVVLHNSLLHSGTENSSSETRFFLGIAYNRSYMLQQDNFRGPNCLLLQKHATDHRDHRLLRLLGCDEKLEDRLNSGFLRPDEEYWAQWKEEDLKEIQLGGSTS
jgi:hypothetical protein